MVFCTEFLDGWWSWELLRGSCDGADGSVRQHPHRKHDLRSGSQDHHPSKYSVQKTICCNSISNAPDDGRMYPKHIELKILTHSMVQSPSWKANWFAASQEIPRISRNPKVHYRTHKPPPNFSILGQPNPVHIPTSHLLEIHPNIIHPSMPRSPQWSPSLRYPHQDPIHAPLFTHTCHIPSPSHSSRFYHPHNIWWEVQII